MKFEDSTEEVAAIFGSLGSAGSASREKKRHDFVSDDWEDYEGVFHTVSFCRICYIPQEQAQTDFCSEECSSETTEPTTKLYCWTGKIFNEFGGIVEKSCIGSLQSVATQLALNQPFPSNETPKIHRIKLLAGLNDSEKQEVETIKREVDDI